MGGSGEDPSKGIDGSAGGLVWDHQRNEAVWPSKSLGPDVLPGGSVPIPRSGTDSGKILGADDANVDCYKLKKSKRLKAFRLGDHNHGIEKVKASASNSDESQDSDDSLSSSEGNSDSFEECEKLRGLEDLGMNVEQPPPLKRTRSRFSHNQESSLLLKSKNQQHALMKRSKMASIHVGEQLLSPNRISLLERGSRKNDMDSNGDISITTESESCGNLYDVPLVAEEKGSPGLPSIISDAPLQSSQSSHVHTSSLSSEENESSHTGSEGFPQWRSKGKRNSRSRKSQVAETQAVWGRDTSSINTEPRPIVQIRSVPFRQSRLTVNPKYDQSGFSLQSQHAAGRCLYDVPIEVKSSSRSHRLPYVSLVSKLTGCPIVGHPLTVEVLDDDDISGCHYNPSKGGDGGRVHKHKAIDRPHGHGKHRANSRKSGGLLSKKTRRLSSFTGAHRLSRGTKKPLAVQMVKVPPVACVPINVVFSRMNADLSSLVRPRRHPSVEVI